MVYFSSALIYYSSINFTFHSEHCAFWLEWSAFQLEWSAFRLGWRITVCIDWFSKARNFFHCPLPFSNSCYWFLGVHRACSISSVIYIVYMTPSIEAVDAGIPMHMSQISYSTLCRLQLLISPWSWSTNIINTSAVGCCAAFALVASLWLSLRSQNICY